MNTSNYVLSRIPESDRAEFEILQKFNLEGQYEVNVNPEDVLIQLDRIQVLKNLKYYSNNYNYFDYFFYFMNLRLAEETSGMVDPEQVRYAKLKARVLLGEEG